ncbi:MAG: SWIM zinc finger domain-containing protein [Methanothrix sp.]|nr:SWIM zinc finger domain-containing protein [Methanothrix sp.]MDI9399200.1 SWIM zinc finger family protein [Euryarchaeota archaeon]
MQVIESITNIVSESMANDLPEGVHAPEGVEYLARHAGWKGSQLPKFVGFGEELGFTEPIAFIKTSNRRGYYQTTLSKCSCPDFRFRKGPTGQLCRHQKALAVVLHKRGNWPPVTGVQAINRPTEVPSLKWTAEATRTLPRGVKPLSEEELQVRKMRIYERNLQHAEGRAKDSTPSTSKGFYLPEEVLASCE